MALKQLTKALGHTQIVITAEYSGDRPITNALAKINDRLLCVIDWSKRENFAQELAALIEKYKL